VCSSAKHDPAKASQVSAFLKQYTATELVGLLQKKYGEAPKISSRELAPVLSPDEMDTMHKKKQNAGKFSLEFSDLVDFYNKYDMSKTHRAREFMNLYNDPAELLRLLDKKYGDSPPLTQKFVRDGKDVSARIKLKEYEKHLQTGDPPQPLGEDEEADHTGDENYVRSIHVSHMEKDVLIEFYKKRDPDKIKWVDVFLAEFR
jgi:hypothetical protein